MDLSDDVISQVGVTAATMLADELRICPLALYEEEYLLVVKGSIEHSQQTGAGEREFPLSSQVFVLYRK